jgi:hypothetical protein
VRHGDVLLAKENHPELPADARHDRVNSESDFLAD